MDCSFIGGIASNFHQSPRNVNTHPSQFPYVKIPQMSCFRYWLPPSFLEIIAWKNAMTELPSEHTAAAAALNRANYSECTSAGIHLAAGKKTSELPHSLDVSP